MSQGQRHKYDAGILHRIQGFGDTCIDMIANDCCYHNLCLLNFLRQRKTEKKKSVTVSEIFIKILPYLENSLFTKKKILTVAEIRIALHKEAKLWNLNWNPNYPTSDDIIHKIQIQFKDKVVVVPRGAKLSSYVCSTKTIIENLEATKMLNSSDSEDLPRQPHSPYKLQSNAYNFAKHLREDITLCRSNQNSIEISKACASNIIPKSVYNFFA